MNQFQSLFSAIRERDEILEEIKRKPALSNSFNKMSKANQERFLELCGGAKGLRILSDPFFKEIMNPEYTPGRVESFLSCILNQNVKILQVLPNDSVRIASEATLLITDIVVELEDGSIVNIEIQRIGYMFPGERAACYSADMLLRQYKRIRENRGKKFLYKDVKPVYTIVLFEKSPSEFHIFPKNYIHYIEPRSDTGIKLNLLQKYIFVSLDIFKKKGQNEAIKDELEAWLTFFSTDHPQRIEHLLDNYPYFTSLYTDIYNLCMNTERMMEVFSKELQLIDENTVQYMMDELQTELDARRAELDARKAELDASKAELDASKAELDARKAELDARKAELDARKAELVTKNTEIDTQRQTISEQRLALEEKDRLIQQLQEQLQKQ